MSQWLWRDILQSGFSLRLNFVKNSRNLFDYVSSFDEVVIHTNEESERKDILDCLDRSGALTVETTFMVTDETRFARRSTNVPRPEWSDWFMSRMAPERHLIPDTNILMRHYCSNLLYRLLGEENFNNLTFRIPRLDILEIERMANQKAQARAKEKRLAFFATTEIMFLKKHGATLLPATNVPLLTSFLEKAGKGMIDAWIRREVHDVRAENCIFLTSDLTNSLSSYAEGLNTCYFSRRAQDQYFVETGSPDAEQLAEFVLSIAVTFESVRMDIYVGGGDPRDSFILEGVWSGKTPYHWDNDCLRASEV